MSIILERQWASTGVYHDSSYTWGSILDPRLVIKILIKRDEEGWYNARGIDFPEIITQGNNHEEVITNIVEAVELVLEVKYDHIIPYSLALINE